jgi:hypothetical protein
MSATLDLSNVEWAKSSYSNGGGGQCIEWAPSVAAQGDFVPVRDSKDPDGPVLAFRAAAWSAFTEAIRSGKLLLG